MPLVSQLVNREVGGLFSFGVRSDLGCQLLAQPGQLRIELFDDFLDAVEITRSPGDLYRKGERSKASLAAIFPTAAFRAPPARASLSASLASTAR